MIKARGNYQINLNLLTHNHVYFGSSVVLCTTFIHMNNIHHPLCMSSLRHCDKHMSKNPETSARQYDRSADGSRPGMNYTPLTIAGNQLNRLRSDQWAANRSDGQDPLPEDRKVKNNNLRCGCEHLETEEKKKLARKWNYTDVSGAAEGGGGAGNHPRSRHIVNSG